VLALVAIALLMLSVMSLGAIKSFSDHSVDVSLFRSSAERLSWASDEVCALGSGNQRSVLMRSSFDLAPSGGGFSMEKEGVGIARPSRCPLEAAHIKEGPLIVRNEGGSILLYQD